MPHIKPFCSSKLEIVFLIAVIVFSAICTSRTCHAQVYDRWISVGPAGASVLTVAVDPTNVSVMYVGTLNGIYKSINGGSSWALVFGPCSVYDLIVNPNSSNTLYSRGSCGFAKSTDWGMNWGFVNIGITGGFSRDSKLIVDPSNPYTLYMSLYATQVGNGGGIAKSTNGGDSWSQSLSGRNVSALMVDPLDGNIVYGIADGFLFKSQDGGKNWSNRGQVSQGPVRALVANPGDPSVIYAASQDSGILKITGGGAQWSTSNAGLTNLAIGCVLVDGSNSNTLYLGTRSGAAVYRSRTAGGSWELFSSGLQVDGLNGYAGGDVNSLIYEPRNGNRIYAATSNGLFTYTFSSNPQDTSTLLFPQVAIGGGYSTTFTLMNTGGTPCNGTLTLTNSNGGPWVVSVTESGLMLTPSVIADFQEVAVSSVSVNLGAGAMKTVTAAALSPGASTQTGWGRFEYSGGSIGGVATYRLVDGVTLRAAVGVVASDGAEFATIPVDNDTGRSRMTGFAIANPNSESVSVKLVLVDPFGNVVDTVFPTEINPLGAHQQIARFLQDYLPSRLNFKGSMVLIAQGKKKIAIVALMLEQGSMTAIPVIFAKAPTIPN